MIWIAIAAGGALGSILRHGMNVVVHRLFGEVVPWAVAAVNLVGCLLIGVLAGMIASARWAPDHAMRSFVVVGILGGFTTFSSLGLDTFALVRDGRPLVALMNVFAQITIGLAAVFLGYAVGHR